MEGVARANTGVIHRVHTPASWDRIYQAAGDRKLIVVAFSAAWCGPCRRMEPELTALAEEFKDVWFVKIDVDAARGQILAVGSVRSLPSYALIRGEKQVDAMKGAHPKQLRELIEQHRVPPADAPAQN
jgi:thioredoxin 1